MRDLIITRYMPLDDIEVKKDGTGRTVRAYAAPFDTPVDIADGEGEYIESIDRAAFNKTIRDNESFPVFYNHGATIQGAPSELYSMPLGRGTATPDGRGLMTETKYTRSRVADEVLDSIHEGVIRAQSFSGSTVRSTPTRPRGGYRRSASGLPRVVRHEIAMKEFGPTPFPYYPTATIESVRSLTGALMVESLLHSGTIDVDMNDGELAAAVRAALTATPSGVPVDRNATSSEAGATDTVAVATLRAHQVRARLIRMGITHEPGITAG